MVLKVGEIRFNMKKELSDKEVVGIVAEKKRFKKNPTNFAVRKHELMKEKVTKILIYLFYFFILFLTYPLMDVYLFCPFYHFFVFFNWECEKVLWSER